MKWEYSVGDVPEEWEPEFINRWLANRGADGWELVSVVRASGYAAFRYAFKRPLVEPAPERTGCIGPFRQRYDEHGRGM